MYRSTQHDAIAPGQIEKADGSLGRSDLDLQAWTRALCALPAAPVTESDVLAWVDEPLRQFFLFDRFWLAYDNLSGVRVRILLLLSSGHSAEILTEIFPRFDVIANLRETCS